MSLTETTPPTKNRKVIQVATVSLGNGTVLVLCDDGTLWAASPLTDAWRHIDTSVVEDASTPLS